MDSGVLCSCSGAETYSSLRLMDALLLLLLPGMLQINTHDLVAQAPSSPCREHSESHQGPTPLVATTYPSMSVPPAADAVLSQLRHHWSDWHQRYHLKAIGLFGSVARGEQRPGSDIDIWVELEPLTPFALVHLKQELNSLLPAPVDVVRLRQRMNPALRQRIEREGVAA